LPTVLKVGSVTTDPVLGVSVVYHVYVNPKSSMASNASKVCGGSEDWHSMIPLFAAYSGAKVGAVGMSLILRVIAVLAVLVHKDTWLSAST